MVKLLKITAVLLFALLSSLFIYSKAFATHQEISSWVNGHDVGQDPSLWADQNLDFKSKPGDARQGLRIDGTVRTVVVSFVGLEHGANNEYFVCGQRDQDSCRLSKKATQKRFRPNDQGEIHIEVCAGGVDWLKGVKVKSPTNVEHLDEDYIEVKGGCNEDKDWFHEGEVYRLWLYQDKEAENLITSAEFFVRHSYPVVKIEPVGDGNFNSLRPIKLSLWGRRPGGNNENNYQVVLEGTNNNTKTEKCTTAPEGGITEPGKTPPNYTVRTHSQAVDRKTQKITQPNHLFNGTGFEGIAASGPSGEAKLERKGGAGLGQGSFVLKINERMSDSRPLGIGESCEGGHSYLYIYFRFDPKAPRGLDIFKVAYDPNNADWEDISEELLDLQYEAPPLPCAPGALQDEKCTAVNTAIDSFIGGPINTTPQGFIGSIFRFVLSIAGFGAVILIIYSGYLLMTSQGDKERIAGARETITSAIVGLLFIILSFIILEIIGFDILRIPGITR